MTVGHHPRCPFAFALTTMISPRGDVSTVISRDQNQPIFTMASSSSLNSRPDGADQLIHDLNRRIKLGAVPPGVTDIVGVLQLHPGQIRPCLLDHPGRLGSDMAINRLYVTILGGMGKKLGVGLEAVGNEIDRYTARIRQSGTEQHRSIIGPG